MTAVRTIRMALRALSRNTLRSLLTTLGIIIGVACVVATMGIGQGASQQAEEQLLHLRIIAPGRSGDLLREGLARATVARAQKVAQARDRCHALPRFG